MFMGHLVRYVPAVSGLWEMSLKKGLMAMTTSGMWQGACATKIFTESVLLGLGKENV